MTKINNIEVAQSKIVNDITALDGHRQTQQAAIQIQEESLELLKNRVGALEMFDGDQVVSNHDCQEYFKMLDRCESTKNAGNAMGRFLDFVAPVEMLKNFTTHGQEVEFNTPPRNIDLSESKILRFFISKLRVRSLDYVGLAGTHHWRGQKLCIPIQLKNPNFAKQLLERRKNLRVQTEGPDASKNNCSLGRTLGQSQQKVHSMLSRMRKNGKFDDIFISMAGYVNIKIINVAKNTDPNAKDFVRTILDKNEMLYFDNCDVIDTNIIVGLNNREVFVDSNLNIVDVPDNFKRKKPEVIEME